MAAIRDHRIFTIKADFHTRDRIQDDLGEMVGYGKEYTIERTFVVVAPSENIAKAWASDQYGFHSIISVGEQVIDAFIQEHGW